MTYDEFPQPYEVNYTHSGWYGVCPVFIAYPDEQSTYDEDEPPEWIYRHWVCMIPLTFTYIGHGLKDMYNRIVKKDTEYVLDFWGVERLEKPFSVTYLE